MYKHVIGVLAATVGLSAMADEAKFKVADEAFGQREGNVAKVQEARAKYLEIAATATGADLERAVVGAARSVVYEGKAYRHDYRCRYPNSSRSFQRLLR